MLAPDERILLLDALRPPADMELAHAVGTTFTLDLATALTVPLAFAGYSLSAGGDTIAVMEAVRSTAAALDIFCQAGSVTSVRWPGDLLVLLEDVVHEVRRPKPGHLFHPKVWVLRYGGLEDNEVFRVLMLSRNLTVDRSWDLILRLDGTPSKQINRDNDGLVRFVSSLPEITKDELEPERAAQILALADALRRVEWEMPGGVSAAWFLPLGLPRMQRPKLDDYFMGHRHLIVSPFLTERGIDAVVRPSSGGSDVTIVSRKEELDRLPTGALDDCTVLTIDPLAALSEDEGVEATVASAELPTLFGALHTKGYVIESGKKAWVLVGSANATDAGFGGNIELLCVLEGGASKLGVAQILGDEKTGFLSMLAEYTPPAEPIVDEEAEAVRALDEYLVDLAQISFVMHTATERDGWSATISTSEQVPVASAVEALFLAPFNRPVERYGLDLGAVVFAELRAREKADLTPYLLITATGAVNGKVLERSTVMRATLVDGPSDRLEEILIRQIDTPEKFLRLLFLLLGLGSDPSVFIQTQDDGSYGSIRSWHQTPTGVFELLVRALATKPEGIDRLTDIVERLRDHDIGKTVLPPEWDDLWSAITESTGAGRTRGSAVSTPYVAAGILSGLHDFQLASADTRVFAGYSSTKTRRDAFLSLTRPALERHTWSPRG